MRLVVTLAVSVAIVGHLWFGCCTQHAHVAAGEQAAVAEHAYHGHAHQHGGHHHGHHHHAAAGQHTHPLVPGGPAVPHHHCQENDCTMLQSGKVLLPDAGALVNSVVEVFVAPAGLLSAVGTSFAEPLFAPHVRSHLAHRVLRV